MKKYKTIGITSFINGNYFLVNKWDLLIAKEFNKKLENFLKKRKNNERI